MFADLNPEVTTQGTHFRRRSNQFDKMRRMTTPAGIRARLLLLAAGLLLSGPSGFTSSLRAGEEPTTQITLRIETEIDCPGCEDRIRELLARGRGVRRVEVDVMESRFAVRYEPARCTVASLLARVEATGYHARTLK